MKRSLRGVAILLCLSVSDSRAVADGGERPENTETIAADQLRGTWMVTSIEMMGMKIPLPQGQQMLITFDGGKAIMNDGMRREESTYKLDDAKMPKGIDLSGPKNQGNQLMKGIYQIEGDTLKIGFSATGPMGTRPTAFDGKDVGVMILKRKR